MVLPLGALNQVNDGQNRATIRNNYMIQRMIAYIFLTYGTAIWSIYYCVISSYSFLEATLKLKEGFHPVIWFNFFLLNAGLLGKYVLRLMFGELRLIEYEHVVERISYTVINIVMTSSMFRTPDIPKILLFNIQYIYYKVIHWILKDRMEFIFQVDSMHARIADIFFSRFMFNLCVVFAIDVFMTMTFFTSSLDGDTGHIYLSFAVQCGLLLLEIIHIILLSSLNLYEIYIVQRRARERNIPEYALEEHELVDRPTANESDDEEEILGLEGKFIFEKMIEIVIGIFKMMIELPMLLAFNMPVSGLFEFLWQVIHIFKAGGLLWNSWKGSKKLDSSLHTVSDEQLLSKQVDACIICMDDFLPSDLRKSESKKPKILRCGHALHLSCLKSWIERSPTCPMCRLPIFDNSGNKTNTTNGDTNEGVEQPVTGNDQQQSSEQNSERVSSSRLGSTTDDSSHSPRATPSRPDTINIEWITVPLHRRSRDVGTFKIVTESGHEVQATMRIKRKISDNSGSIIVPNEVLEGIEGTSLKRKNAELESRIEELSKKIKKD